jgi:hypothetical protein
MPTVTFADALVRFIADDSQLKGAEQQILQGVSHAAQEIQSTMTPVIQLVGETATAAEREMSAAARAAAEANRAAVAPAIDWNNAMKALGETIPEVTKEAEKAHEANKEGTRDVLEHVRAYRSLGVAILGQAIPGLRMATREVNLVSREFGEAAGQSARFGLAVGVAATALGLLIEAGKDFATAMNESTRAVADMDFSRLMTGLKGTQDRMDDFQKNWDRAFTNMAGVQTTFAERNAARWSFVQAVWESAKGGMAGLEEEQRKWGEGVALAWEGQERLRMTTEAVTATLGAENVRLAEQAKAAETGQEIADAYATQAQNIIAMAQARANYDTLAAQAEDRRLRAAGQIEVADQKMALAAQKSAADITRAYAEADAKRIEGIKAAAEFEAKALEQTGQLVKARAQDVGLAQESQLRGLLAVTAGYGQVGEAAVATGALELETLEQVYQYDRQAQQDRVDAAKKTGVGVAEETRKLELLEQKYTNDRIEMSARIVRARADDAAKIVQLEADVAEKALASAETELDTAHKISTAYVEAYGRAATDTAAYHEARRALILQTAAIEEQALERTHQIQVTNQQAYIASLPAGSDAQRHAYAELAAMNVEYEGKRQENSAKTRQQLIQDTQAQVAEVVRGIQIQERAAQQVVQTAQAELEARHKIAQADAEYYGRAESDLASYHSQKQALIQQSAQIEEETLARVYAAQVKGQQDLIASLPAGSEAQKAAYAALEEMAIGYETKRRELADKTRQAILQDRQQEVQDQRAQLQRQIDVERETFAALRAMGQENAQNQIAFLEEVASNEQASFKTRLAAQVEAFQMRKQLEQEYFTLSKARGEQSVTEEVQRLARLAMASRENSQERIRYETEYANAQRQLQDQVASAGRTAIDQAIAGLQAEGKQYGTLDDIQQKAAEQQKAAQQVIDEGARHNIVNLEQYSKALQQQDLYKTLGQLGVSLRQAIDAAAGLAQESVRGVRATVAALPSGAEFTSMTQAIAQASNDQKLSFEKLQVSLQSVSVSLAELGVKLAALPGAFVMAAASVQAVGGAAAGAAPSVAQLAGTSAAAAQGVVAMGVAAQAVDTPIRTTTEAIAAMSQATTVFSVGAVQNWSTGMQQMGFVLDNTKGKLQDVYFLYQTMGADNTLVMGLARNSQEFQIMVDKMGLVPPAAQQLGASIQSMEPSLAGVNTSMAQLSTTVGGLAPQLEQDASKFSQVGGQFGTQFDQGFDQSMQKVLTSADSFFEQLNQRVDAGLSKFADNIYEGVIQKVTAALDDEAARS